jgi:hypothetical protein
LPEGTLPAVANVRAVAQAVSGDVLVQLPGRAAFVSLAGVAALPVGTTVDARKGRLTLTTAVTAKGKLGRGTFGSAIFTIRQKRLQAAKRKARTATQIVIRTPKGQERACAATRPRPLKGVVRTLTGTAKGLYQAVGAASTTSVESATWLIEDTCDGTRTSVRRGKVTVHAARKRDVTVRAGKQYLVRAKLFAARKKRHG